MKWIPEGTISSGFGYAKALIFGEYAVMYGTPGLAVALTPKLHLSVQIENAPINDGFESKLAHIMFEKVGLHTRVSIDNSAFYDEYGYKYGIGSSAASVVALVEAWNAIEHTPKLSINDAIEMHRALQNGMGSGIDVIASAHGGLVCAKNCPENPEFSRVFKENMPPIAIIATHRPAPTCDFIGAAKKVENTREYRMIIEALSEINRELAHTITQKNQISQFLEQISHIPALLQQLATCIDRPILPASFENWRSHAREFGVTLKTSGAGGGDILLALAQNRDEIERYLAAIPPQFTAIPAEIAPERHREMK